MAALGGCTSLRNTPYYGTITGALSRKRDSGVSRAAADRIPYASMAAWFDGDQRALLVLGTIGPNRRLDWFTAMQQSITTFGPFIVAAIGLEVELRDTKFGPGWSTDLRSMDGRRVSRDVSFQADRRIETNLTSHFAIHASEQVEIYGLKRTLLKVTERVASDGVLRFINRYWVDAADGFCWRSEQRFIPTSPAFNIEIRRRPNVD